MSELASLGNLPEILAIEKVIKQMEQGYSETKHYQIEGVYVRSLFIPAGTLLTGKIHNKESIGILAQGTIRIANGTDSFIVSAPYITIDMPGIKRLGYAETDCTFITVHRTDATNIPDIEDDLVSDTFEEFELKTQHLLEERRS